MSDNEYPDEYLDENGNEYQEEKPEQERGELKPCPFCGTLPQANAWIFRGISETRYFCPNQECPLSVRTVTLEEWNTRPIEDALNARIAELEAENNRLAELLLNELSQVEIATDLGNKRWTALQKISEDGEKHNTNWCKRVAQEGLGIKNA